MGHERTAVYLAVAENVVDNRFMHSAPYIFYICCCTTFILYDVTFASKVCVLHTVSPLQQPVYDG